MTAPFPTPEHTATVSILMLMFDDVELLDFAGPYEVFTTANRMAARMRLEAGDTTPAAPVFELVTASVDGAPVRARAGLRLSPDHALATAPATTWLLVPGGVVDQLLANPALLAELARRGQHAGCIASVCTGAFVLAAAGLLQHAPATTHWEDQADLAQRHPHLQVLDGPRWVEAGRCITSAGIAAGIDMALHLVARHAGSALAQRTARQMDTPWHQHP